MITSLKTLSDRCHTTNAKSIFLTTGKAFDDQAAFAAENGSWYVIDGADMYLFQYADALVNSSTVWQNVAPVKVFRAPVKVFRASMKVFIALMKVFIAPVKVFIALMKVFIASSKAINVVLKTDTMLKSINDGKPALASG